MLRAGDEGRRNCRKKVENLFSVRISNKNIAENKFSVRISEKNYGRKEEITLYLRRNVNEN